MKFLVDVCVSRAAAEFLRTEGHEVQLVYERDPRLSDEDILSWANEEDKILLTRDKDFGGLVFVEKFPHRGIIRLPNVRRKVQVNILKQIIERHADVLSAGAIIAAGRERIRIHRRLISS